MKCAKVYEFYAASVGADDIDREHAVIRNVKLLGKHSRNGRTYSDKARSQAVKLFENKPVYTNHDPQKQVRDMQDQIGWVDNIRQVGDEVFGDFHVKTAHPMSAQVFETAERNPSLLGFSLAGSGNVSPSLFASAADVVEELTEVSSLDLVTAPATTSGLFESQEQGRPPVPKKRIREVVVGLPKTPGKSLLMEMVDSEAMAAEMEVPVAEMDGEQQALEAMKAAIVEAISKAGSVAEAAKAVLAMLSPSEPAPEPVAEEESADATTTAAPAADQPLQEAFASKLAAMQVENARLAKKVGELEKAAQATQEREGTRKLFEARGLNPNDEQMQVALALSPDLRRKYIAGLTEAVGGTGGVRDSGAGGNDPDPAELEFPRGKDFVNQLK